MLTGLCGTNDRVVRAVEVLRRVLVLGGIAATDVPTREALAQMDPLVAGLDAIFTDASRLGDVLYLIEV